MENKERIAKRFKGKNRRPRLHKKLSNPREAKPRPKRDYAARNVAKWRR